MTKQLSPLRRKDREAGYQAAVRDIMAWLREEDGHGYDDMRADIIEAKFGKANETKD